jgi:hypothetical protein
MSRGWGTRLAESESGRNSSVTHTARGQCFGIEMHRFDREDQALEGAYAVEELERFVPEQHEAADHGANRRAFRVRFTSP